MKNKVINFMRCLASSVYNLVFPNVSFLIKLKKRNFHIIFYTVGFQLLAGLLTAVLLILASPFIKPSLINNVTDILYGGILTFPIFIFCITLAFNHYASLLGGKGRLQDHFKLMLWSFYYMFASSMLISIFLSLFSVILNVEIPEITPAIVYGGTFAFYSVHAMRVSMEMTILRSFICHLVLLMSVAFGRFAFQLLFDV
ncbi:hypothetical protein [Psychromonas sp. SP041]|uniref:hypothetical protein n=1 Tax=Psychromonas sp. SP041 TaxID=1365007 RepID=UPI0010C7CBD8|nr:hypothetical protein [Psychromonas sp. SP041]